MMSLYGQNLYVDLITKRETTIPDLFLVLCGENVVATDTGATITEASPRFTLAMGLSGWGDIANGVRSYLGNSDFYLEEDLDDWGLVSSYAIVDSAGSGTGNVLFFGNITPVTMIGPSIVAFSDLAIEVPV